MSARHQRRMAPRLSALRDGDLGRLQAALLRRHLRRCAPCQQVLADLGAQARALSALRTPADDLAAPPLSPAEEARWQALERALAEPQRPAPRRALPRPALPLALAAGLGAVLVLSLPKAAGLLDLLRPGPSDEEIVSRAAAEFREAERHYQRALQQLERAARRREARFGPAEALAYRARLQELRERTAQRRAQALRQPADAEVQEQLYAAYRSEIAFLQASLRQEPARGEVSP